MRWPCRASLWAKIVPKELHKQTFPGRRCVTWLDQGPYRCSPRPRGVGFASAAYWTFSRDMVVRFGDLSGTGSTVFWVVIGVSGLAGGLAGDLVQRFGLSGAFRVSVLSMAAAIGLLAAAPGVLLWAYSSAALFGSTYIMLTGIILVWSVWVFHERPSAGLVASYS